ncbi:MAG: exodeoxyribonuclease I, partial [Lysobacterales bacterium]
VDPFATLVTGLDPARLLREGLPEHAFAAEVSRAFSHPGTCAVGYNSLHFDDELVRFTFWRNFLDPYRREWADGRSRWDLIDLGRMCYALRPDGIEWPLRADGKPSFRLGDLTRVNGLAHENAHDALADVQATLALARLLRERQPRLFEWHLAARDRKRNHALVDHERGTPLVHVSSRYPAERGCLALVLPLAMLADRPHALVVYDLDAPPDDLIALDADAVRDRLFTPRADLPEGVARIPLKLVHLNHCPALAPLSVLKGVDLARIGLDRERNLAHARQIVAAGSLAPKVREVMRTRATGDADADIALYDGFVSPTDERLRARVPNMAPDTLDLGHLPFVDPRLRGLLPRYRARNFPESLDADAVDAWTQDVSQRLWRGDETRDLRYYAQRVASARATLPEQHPHHALLDGLLARAAGQARRYPETELEA